MENLIFCAGQQELDAVPKVIQQINFKGNLGKDNNTSDYIFNMILTINIREIVSLE